MSRLERAGFAVVLGIFWAWMIIQDTGLADRWDAPAVVMHGAITAASVGMWYGILLLLERLANGHHNGHHPAEVSDSDQCRR